MTAAGPIRSAQGSEQLRDELIDVLVRVTEGKFERAEIDPTVNFFDYGYVDSLTAVVFLAEIEDRYGVEIDDVDVVERLNTVDALAAHVVESRR